LWHDRLYFARL
ncbi:sulfite exporter TauE/SafE family protein, partial [Vibrio parahaemolyticus EKP-028]